MEQRVVPEKAPSPELTQMPPGSDKKKEGKKVMISDSQDGRHDQGIKMQE